MSYASLTWAYILSNSIPIYGLGEITNDMCSDYGGSLHNIIHMENGTAYNIVMWNS